MDEPLRGSLRPARRRGLTSPDPVTAPAPAPAATRQPASPAKPVDKPQKCKRQKNHARHHIKTTQPCPAGGTPSPKFGRWIEAKATGMIGHAVGRRQAHSPGRPGTNSCRFIPATVATAGLNAIERDSFPCHSAEGAMMSSDWENVCRGHRRRPGVLCLQDRCREGTCVEPVGCGCQPPGRVAPTLTPPRRLP